MKAKITIFLMLLPALLSAQTAPGTRRDSTRTESVGYSFRDNWFVQAGAGVNMVFNKGFGPVAPTAELRVGKWTSPAFGFRIGAIGLNNVPNGTETGWFSGRDSFWFGHADADLMWNFMNSFYYSERRSVKMIPYIGASAVYTSQGEGGHIEPAGHAGIHMALRLGERIDLYVEPSAVIGRETAYRERGGVIAFPSVTAGVVIRLGRSGFRRETKTVYIESEPAPPVIIRDTIKVVEDKLDSILIQQMKETPLTLYFEIDQHILTQRELDHLERYAHYVLTPNSKVLLTGSADKETGNAKHNQWLSEKRNAYVKDILMNVYHLKKENIIEQANGDRKNEFRTPEQNRCVTISFVE